MKLTKSSKILMDFFTNNKCINNSTQNKRTTEVLIVLYNKEKYEIQKSITAWANTP